MATINYHPHRAQLGFLRSYLTQVHRFKADIPTVNPPPVLFGGAPGPAASWGAGKGTCARGPWWPHSAEGRGRVTGRRPARAARASARPLKPHWSPWIHFWVGLVRLEASFVPPANGREDWTPGRGEGPSGHQALRRALRAHMAHTSLRCRVAGVSDNNYYQLFIFVPGFPAAHQHISSRGAHRTGHRTRETHPCEDGP